MDHIARARKLVSTSRLGSLLRCLRRLPTEAQFRLRWARLDKEAASAQITAVILTVEPSHLFELCLASVQAQTLRPGQIEIVRNVLPFPRAAQVGLDRVQTPYYVPVDDDMVLKTTCFQRLYQTIAANDNCAEVVMMLEDPLRGRIQGIRMYRTAAVRPLGFYPLEEKGPERRMHRKLKEAGYDTVTLAKSSGQHHPVYLPHEAFWKFRFVGEKVRYYDTGLDKFSRYVDSLIDYWQRTHDVIALYGLAGLFDGLQAEQFDQPLSYEGREQHPAFQKVQAFIQKYSDS